MMKYSFLFLFGVVISVNAHGDIIYKTRNSEGTYKYSDKKPKSSYETIDKGDYKGTQQPEAKESENAIPATRSMETIRTITESAKDKINGAYQDLYIANNDTQGKVAVEFTIEKAGNVSQCKENESDMSGSNFNGKICDIISALNYGPVESSNPVNIKYNYQFQPKI